MNQNLLTVNELANKLKVPKSWVYSRTRQTGPGSIPKVQVGKYIRFPEIDVMDWIQEKQNIGRV
ncbi:MAG TPA: helix-turn-helix domain-containing protein [Desulfatiglandales bacterium]|nr:helix-turn-helix domain-containing protein [Desulfatiglandales bacterium]